MLLASIIAAVPFVVLTYVLTQGPLAWLVVHRHFPGPWFDLYAAPTWFFARRFAIIKAVWYWYLDFWAPSDMEELAAIHDQVFKEPGSEMKP